MRKTLLTISIFLLSTWGISAQNLGSLQKGWSGIGYLPSLSTHSSLEEKFFQAWAKEGKPDTLSLLLVSDPEVDQAAYEKVKARKQKMIADLEKQKIRGRRNASQLKRVQKYLQKHFLQTYDPFASYWDMFSRKTYSSTGATLLYSEVMTHFGIPHARWSNAVYSYLHVDPRGMDVYIDPLDEPEDASLSPLPYDLPLLEKGDFLAYARMAGFVTFDSVAPNRVDDMVYQYYQPEERLVPFQLAGLLYFHLGKGVYRKGKYEQAIPYFEKAFLLYPVLSSRYYAYKSYVGMLKGRDLTEMDDVDLLIKIYQMLPSAVAEEAILVSFKKILVGNMVNGDNEAYVKQVQEKFEQSAVSEDVKIGVSTIYFREKAREAAGDGDYGQARDFMENMKITTAEDQLLAQVVMKNFYNQLEDCTLRELLWKEDKGRYPFLEKQKEILDLVKNCEQGAR
ncbi:MAG: tetratricopeptide repeat protein [Bacteroidota bacterium]